MEVAGNAAGLDLGKRTYEMCLISKDNKIIRQWRGGGAVDRNERSEVRTMSVSEPRNCRRL